MRAPSGKLPARLPAIVLGWMLVGCTSPPPIFPPVDPPIVWPSSGDPPRLRYVGTLWSEEDLGDTRSFWDWLGDVWGGPAPPAVIRNATDVAVTPTGVLFVADVTAQRVHRFDLGARKYLPITEAGDGALFVTPVGLAVTETELFVVDRSLRRITVLSHSGTLRSTIDLAAVEAPVGVAVGPLSGRLYVTDVSSHHVLAIRRDGSLELAFGGHGSAPGQFNFPTHLACDASENVYVTDSLNCRVQVFDQHGQFLRTWGRRGNLPGEFSRPKGIACDRRGLVYVVDAHFENVQVFTPIGELLLAFGEEGSGPGQFWLPVGIFVDASDTIWVGDSYNSRVQVFRHLDSDVRSEAP